MFTDHTWRHTHTHTRWVGEGEGEGERGEARATGRAPTCLVSIVCRGAETQTPMLSVFLHGPPGSGSTPGQPGCLGVAFQTQFPFRRMRWGGRQEIMTWLRWKHKGQHSFQVSCWKNVLFFFPVEENSVQPLKMIKCAILFPMQSSKEAISE